MAVHAQYPGAYPGAGYGGYAGGYGYPPNRDLEGLVGKIIYAKLLALSALKSIPTNGIGGGYPYSPYAGI